MFLTQFGYSFGIPLTEGNGVNAGRWLWLVVVFLAGSIGLCGELRVPSEYSTIQAAVDAASCGDTVLIAPGTYSETVIVLRKSDLMLQGDVELEVSKVTSVNVVY